MKFISTKSSVRIPRLIASSKAGNSRLNAPWSILEFLPGRTLERAWSSMDLRAKEYVIRQAAEINCNLFSIECPQTIGSYYSSNYELEGITVGPLVTSEGAPVFSDLFSYLECRLQSVMSNTLLTGTSESSRNSTTLVGERIRSIFPGLVSSTSLNNQSNIHRIVLTHLDAEPRNWMDLDDGEVTGLID
ncbi:hypothetical protein BDV93DRAFT_561021 [Ceratobasidium sp. AG-I]|nr:hypothetical protein BDV93DRAFT_561021 [Ceratobasidium sp. AG-I]